MKQVRVNRSGPALEAALESGDFSIAADMLRTGEKLGSELREMLATKIEGKLKSKRGPKRRVNLEILRESRQCFDWLIHYENYGRDAAVVQTAEFFGVTDRTIHNWLKAKPIGSAIDLITANFICDSATGKFGRAFTRDEALGFIPLKVKRFLEK